MLFNDEEYEIIVNKKRVRRITVKVNYKKQIIVTSPKRLSLNDATKLVESNYNVILKLVNKIPKNPLKENEIMIFGKIYQTNLLTEKEIIEIKNNALLEMRLMLKLIVAKNHFDPKPNLIIKSMKSRWGVCYLKKQTIALTSYLIHVPHEIVEYVIYHELCHFKYPNHSKDFYLEVSKYCPNYKILSKELKKYSFFLK